MWIGQTAVRHRVYHSGQHSAVCGVCFFFGSVCVCGGGGVWDREEEGRGLLSDKDHCQALIFGRVIRGYKVSYWVDKQDNATGTNKHSVGCGIYEALAFQRTVKQTRRVQQQTSSEAIKHSYSQEIQTQAQVFERVRVPQTETQKRAGTKYAPALEHTPLSPNWNSQMSDYVWSGQRDCVFLHNLEIFWQIQWVLCFILLAFEPRVKPKARSQQTESPWKERQCSFTARLSSELGGIETTNFSKQQAKMQANEQAKKKDPPAFQKEKKIGNREP